MYGTWKTVRNRRSRFYCGGRCSIGSALQTTPMARSPDRLSRSTIPAHLLALLLAAGGCTLISPEPETPMPSEVLREAGTSGCTAVLLPGRWDRMSGFGDAGFAERSERAGVDVGLAAADAHIGYYREEVLVPRLRQDVIGPLLSGEATQRVWLVGTSLGAVGSLIYWNEHPEQVAGLVLVAPWLGEEELLEEIRAAGDLQDWRPETIAEDDFGRRIWQVLRRVTAPESHIPVLLAYGTGDDLAPGHRLLARELPDERVFTVDGGHDWDAWGALWSRVLSSGILCAGD